MNPACSKTHKSLLKVISFVAVNVLVLCALNAQAQEKNPKYEIGLHYASLNVVEKSDTDGGLGVRFTYNLNDYLGLEAETTFFPTRREGGPDNERQGLFGARVGKRNKRFGVFGKARTGVTHFYSLVNTIAPPTVFGFQQGFSRFSVDVGGVFEYYPHRNVAVRVDAGDTMIRFKQGDFFFRHFEPVFVQRKLSHNLQINVGVAFRF
jgi:hypothetical protein